MTRAACTIISLNYLPYARVLCDSFLRLHPDYRFYVLVVDRPTSDIRLDRERFEPIFVEDLDIPNFRSLAFRYDILELNTVVKPAFLKHLLMERNIGQLIYFDPDIFIYNSVDFIFDELARSPIVLTPHISQPINDDLRPTERDFLRAGTFNLGFIAVSNAAESQRFLDWWNDRCTRWGYGDHHDGLFVDQKWANLVPFFFPGSFVLKHSGCNVAYWNLHEREITQSAGHFVVNGAEPLVFFHFSGISGIQPQQISKYTDRYTLHSRPDIGGIFQDYRTCLERSAFHASNYKYAFGYFSNGKLVTKLARAVYAMAGDRFSGEDPFDSSGRFYRVAIEEHLLSRSDSSSGYRLKDLNHKDWRLRAINFTLRKLLAILGADKYTGLMRYLGFISNLRNQKDVFLSLQQPSNSDRMANEPAHQGSEVASSTILR